MKNFIVILVLFFSSFYLYAQSFSLEHDHSIIQVKNIDTSVAFYKEILNLQEVATPWPNNKADDLTIKKLTYGNPTMKAKFDELKNKL